MKNNRLAKMLEIIENERIETQKDLSERLLAYGYNVTQATVSRDIKTLGLVKTPCGNGTYKYAQPGAGDGEALFSGNLRTIFLGGVTDSRAARNIVVLKTLSGLAMAVAAAVDAMKFEDILGSLGGDDTVILIFADDERALDFTERIKEMLKGG